MFKKFISIALALVLLVSVSGCVAMPNLDTPSGGDTKPEPSEQPKPTDAAPQVLFQEAVIVDNENITFTIKEIDDNSFFGYTLKAYLENKTDLELMFSLNNVSVNGFMCDPFWASSVTAGMKSNEEISFMDTEFEANGITTVTEITFTLRVSDNNDWMADPILEETFTIYPLGQEAVEPYVRVPVEGEVVLVDNEYCTMIVTGYDPDNMFGYTMNVYLENKTDSIMMFSADSVSVNGFMCDPFWAADVAPGKRSNSQITWMDSTLEENGITEIESITLPVRIYNQEDWLQDAYVEETFTVNP